MATENSFTAGINEDALAFITERVIATGEQEDAVHTADIWQAAVDASNAQRPADAKPLETAWTLKQNTLIGLIRNQYELPNAKPLWLDGKKRRGWRGVKLLGERENESPPSDTACHTPSARARAGVHIPRADVLEDDGLDYRNAAGWAVEWGITTNAARTQCEAAVERGAMRKRRDANGLAELYALIPPDPDQPPDSDQDPEPPDADAPTPKTKTDVGGTARTAQVLSLDLGESLPAGAISYDLPPKPIAGETVALDLETTGLSVVSDSIVAVLVNGGGATHILRPDGETADYIRGLLGAEGVRVITQNGHAFDLPLIERWLGELPTGATLYDTTVAAQVIDPGGRTALDHLIERYLGVQVEKDRTLTKNGFVWLADSARMSRAQEGYCHDDVQYLERLANAMDARN